MDILTRHKKKGEEGFKKFVFHLEQTSETKLRDITQIALLEDPVYMKWVISNIIDFKYIMTLTDDEFTKIFNELPNGLQIFVFAFMKSPLEKKFMDDKLDMKIKRQIQDEMEYLKEITPAQQYSSRLTLLTTMRKLQESYSITPFKWKLPPSNIIKGDHIKVPTRGLFSLEYEDGTMALKGEYESKLRNGIWEHFYPNAQLMAKGAYTHGEKTGDWIFYYTNGETKSKGLYVENLKSGQWEEFSRQGEMTPVLYERGKPK